MKGRIKQRASGGKVDEAGGNPAVFEDLKRKRGGRVEKEKDGGEMKAGKSRLRMDRPGRKAGGRVGANTSPLSTAHSEVGGAPGSPNPNG